MPVSNCNQLFLFLCYQVGISVAARKYDFDATSPFDATDVLDLRPVVKHSVPVCSEAKNLIEMGKLQLAEVPMLFQISCFNFHLLLCCLCLTKMINLL